MEHENCETHIAIKAFVFYLNKSSVQCKSSISLQIVKNKISAFIKYLYWGPLKLH